MVHVLSALPERWYQHLLGCQSGHGGREYERLIHAEGFNLGLNLGRVAGAGLPGHLHWHIVPRWHGDTNFMPAMAAVKVIPQSLDALWELLHEELV